MGVFALCSPISILLGKRRVVKRSSGGAEGRRGAQPNRKGTLLEQMFVDWSALPQKVDFSLNLGLISGVHAGGVASTNT